MITPYNHIATTYAECVMNYLQALEHEAMTWDTSRQYSYPAICKGLDTMQALGVTRTAFTDTVSYHVGLGRP